MSALRSSWIPLAFLLALGCSGGGGTSEGAPTPAELDSDGDGLNDAQEQDLGLDPQSADSDGDGLSDGAELDAGADPLLADTDGDLLGDNDEVTLGTDPALPDTDDDSYTDFEEVDYGSDPLDKQDRIYQGKWPYNPDKEALNDPGFAGTLSLDAQFPDLVAVDQHGDLVHLYDFAGDGKPILVDFSAEWCPPCNALADYLTGVENGFDYPNIRDAIDAGEVYWVTVLLQDNFGAPADQAVCESWATVHPDKDIPVMGPENASEILDWVQLVYFPTLIWVNDDMSIRAYNTAFNPYLGADALENELAGN